MNKFARGALCVPMLLLGTAIVSPAALAQNAGAPPAGDSASSGAGADMEIIVTARRRDERVLDVPLTITGISNDTLAKNNILKFQDLNEIVPGVNLVQGNNGLDANATIRGISYSISSQTSPPYATYINEVSSGLNDLFNETYDLERVEIQRAPQGTLRGASAPSGMFGIYTRRPSLDQAGGYVSTTLTDPRGVNLQGAVGMPIIKGVLGLRIAGVFERNANGNIRSVNNSLAPFSEDRGGRATLYFKPSDNFSASLIFRHNEISSAFYQGAVFGAGAPAFTRAATVTTPAIAIPANFNGPALSRDADRAVGNFPTESYSNTDNITANIDWHFAGQKLAYIGSRNWFDTRTLTQSDTYNILPGKAPNILDQHLRSWQHEIRLSSDDRIAGIFDYTLGYYYAQTKAGGLIAVADAALLDGAFGSPNGTTAFGAFPVTPGSLSPLNLNRSFSIGFAANQNVTTKSEGLFGNLTAHLGERTELSAGVRQVWQHDQSATTGGTTPSGIAITFPSFFGPCTGIGGTAGAYADTCTFPIPSTPIVTTGDTREKPVLWIASASHKFTPDLMAYVSAGTAFRAAPTGALGLPQCNTCASYNNLNSERSTSYEIGLKGALLDRKLKFSVAYFYQTFSNFIARTESSIPFLQTLPGGTQSISSNFFVYNAPVKTQGIDLDVSYRASQDLEVGAALAWAKSRFRNASVPCADSNFDGKPDSGQAPATVAGWTAAGGPSGPALCRTSGPLSSTPPWNLILRGEYSHDAFTDTRAFLRGTLNITPKNTNNTIVNPGFVPKGYALLDLFAGLRGPDGIWEVSIAAKNIFNTRTVLNEGQQDAIIGQGAFAALAPSTGYRFINRVAPRQLQLSFRYAFGSR